MEIRIDPHTLERAEERGTTRQGEYYEQKRVEVFYITEGDAIITVTVYVFYGKWEG